MLDSSLVASNVDVLFYPIAYKSDCNDDVHLNVECTCVYKNIGFIKPNFIQNIYTHYNSYINQIYILIDIYLSGRITTVSWLFLPMPSYNVRRNQYTLMVTYFIQTSILTAEHSLCFHRS